MPLTTSRWMNVSVFCECANSAGMSSAVTARTSEVACTEAARALYVCSSCFRPPNRNDSPSTRSRFPMIEPVSDAFTISVLSSRIRKNAITSSVTLPNVALISPPTRGPVWSASCSVERPIRPASGRIAPAEVTKISRSLPPAISSTMETGTRTSSQSSEGRSFGIREA